MDDVARTTESQIQETEARAAGYPGRSALLADLSQREGDLYRVYVRFAGADPRVALRQSAELGQGGVGRDRAALGSGMPR